MPDTVGDLPLGVSPDSLADRPSSLPGDTIILYTDITQAEAPANFRHRRPGVNDTADCRSGHRHHAYQAGHVRSFDGGPASDDQTIVASWNETFET